MTSSEREQIAAGVSVAILVLVVIVLASLAGCTSTPVPVIPTEVKVPVSVPCVPADRPQKPQILTDQQLKALDDYDLVLTLAIERGELGIYASQLEAVLAGCWVPAVAGT